MARIALFTFPAMGHIHPTLAVIEELTSRGHEVTATCSAAVAPLMETAGATPLVYDCVFGDYYTSTFSDESMLAVPSVSLEDAKSLAKAAEAYFADDVPDLVLYDMIAWAGRFYANKYDVPKICLTTTLAKNETYSFEHKYPLFPRDHPRIIDFGMQMIPVLSEWGMDPNPQVFFSQIADSNIVFVDEQFHCERDTFDDRFVFAGPSLRDRSSFQGTWQPKHQAAKTVLVSLGTAACGWSEFFPLIVDALGDTEWHVVLSTGATTTPDELGDLPSNIEAHQRVPQLDVLRHVDAFVTHGGMNSLMESLYHGVPLVVFPQMNEQRANAIRVAELGVGVALERADTDAAMLRDAINQVADCADTGARVTAMKDRMQQIDGPVIAADTIEKVLVS